MHQFSKSLRPRSPAAVMGACPRLLLSLVLSIGLFAQADVNGQTMGPNLSGSYTQTLLHYTANGNINGKGVYLPGADGFNLADVSSVGSLDALPAGVKGLVYLDACGGATASFTRRVKQFKNKPKLFGFYLMDEPDPGSCRARNLKAEADWIHANVPGAETFIVLMNMSSDTTPTFKNTYNPANTDVDLFGLDPYPCQQQFNGCDYRIIPAAIAAAEAWGISASQIVPVYQAFGGGGYSAWLMPTAAEETQLLATWASAIPAAVFDYVYSWGVQSSDQALSTAPDLQAVFLQKNTGQ